MLLHGVRVLDLSRLLPGGYCTQLLQAQGATVTKIEPPAGDPIRALPGGAAYFDALHRGKQLLTLDLRTEDGREALRRRVVDADVLVEGFRPGVMERMELGYPALAAINPALVYCAITGYGSSGPLARRAGHDLNYLARSGRGSRVEVSMADLMRSWTALPRAARGAGLAGLPLTGELPCYHVYAVTDGFLTVAALESDFWAAFCHAINREDLKDHQFDPAAIEAVQATLGQATRAEWAARFGDQDVCVEPALRLDES